MKKQITIESIKKHLFKIGILIIIIGFLYDPGIPYQDPPEELLIEYQRNKTIANTVMLIGLIVLMIGIIVKLFFKKNITEQQNQKE